MLSCLSFKSTLCVKKKKKKERKKEKKEKKQALSLVLTRNRGRSKDCVKTTAKALTKAHTVF